MAGSSNKITFLLSLSLLALLVSGTRACQEDYDLGSRTSVTPTSDETPTPTPSASPTPTPTPTPSPTPDEEETPTPDEDETPTPSEAAARAATRKTSLADSLLKSLADLTGSDDPASSGNWGEQWKNSESGTSKELVPGTAADSDKDGYSDSLEKKHNSDPLDQYSYPKNITTTSLTNRLFGLDDDGDGLSNEIESDIGTNMNLGDSDEDGARDGAEKLSGSDPLDSNSKPSDLDGDGLATDYENSEGTNPSSADTDDDGLRDDLEIALGTSPFNADTDSDGILDGQEVEIGSDPVKAE